MGNSVSADEVLVDLDNVMFGAEGAIDVACAEARMGQVEQVRISTRTVLFCNEGTRRAAEGMGLEAIARFVVPPPEMVAETTPQDAADHMLLHAAKAHLDAGRKVAIVTADKTLARLVHFLCPPDKLKNIVYVVFIPLQPKELKKLQKSSQPPPSCKHSAKLYGPERFRLNFNDSADLTGFIASYELYQQRAAKGWLG